MKWTPSTTNCWISRLGLALHQFQKTAVKFDTFENTIKINMSVGIRNLSGYSTLKILDENRKTFWLVDPNEFLFLFFRLYSKLFSRLLHDKLMILVIRLLCMNPFLNKYCLAERGEKIINKSLYDYYLKLIRDHGLFHLHSR